MERKFLEDRDTIVIRGWASNEEEGLVGFDNREGRTLEAIPLHVALPIR